MLWAGYCLQSVFNAHEAAHGEVFDHLGREVRCGWVYRRATLKGHRRTDRALSEQRHSGRVYHRFVSVLFGLRVRDTDCDFRLIRRAALDRVHLEKSSGVICVELVRKLQFSGVWFVEVGVHHHPRLHGRSTFFRVGNLARTLRDLQELWQELVFVPMWQRHKHQWIGAAALGSIWPFTFLIALRRPVGRADEAWFLLVAARVNSGTSLYRGVYYVTTPLAMWCMQVMVRLFGTQIAVERALASTCFVDRSLSRGSSHDESG